MALFRRKRAAEGAVPEEVSQYYQAENRDRTWMAWLLALVSLAVSAIVVMALFFGGRWMYRKVRNQPTGSTTATTQKVSQPSNKNTSSPQTSTTPATSSSSTTTSSSNGSVNAPANPATTPGSSSAASTSSATSTATPATPTTPNSSSLPNTGPGDTIAIFFAVSILAYVVHRKVSTK